MREPKKRVISWADFDWISRTWCENWRLCPCSYNCKVSNHGYKKTASTCLAWKKLPFVDSNKNKA